MKIKIGKFEANVSVLGVILAAAIADNMYANHCRKSLIKQVLKKEVNKSPQEES